MNVVCLDVASPGFVLRRSETRSQFRKDLRILQNLIYADGPGSFAMSERYGHLFSHSTQHVAETADRIFDALKSNCRTVVVNAVDRSENRAKKRPILNRIKRF